MASSGGELPDSARRFSQAICSLPPLAIASRAFNARLRIASPSWFGSTHAGLTPGSARISRRMSGLIVCLRIFSASSTTAETSTALGCKDCRRAKVDALAMHADAAAGGDEDVAVVQRV